jgi:hypothetical protein
MIAILGGSWIVLLGVFRRSRRRIQNPQGHFLGFFGFFERESTLTRQAPKRSKSPKKPKK